MSSGPGNFWRMLLFVILMISPLGVLFLLLDLQGGVGAKDYALLLAAVAGR